MMQSDDVSSVELMVEHEIIFDDDEDDGENIDERITTSTNRLTAQSSLLNHHHHHHHPIENFQPLAGNIDEAVLAAIRLESFLSSSTSASTNTVCNTNIDNTAATVGIMMKNFVTNNDPFQDLSVQLRDQHVVPPVNGQPMENIPLIQQSTTTGTTGTSAQIQTLSSNIAIGNTTNHHDSTSRSIIDTTFDPYSGRQRGQNQQQLVPSSSCVQSLFDDDRYNEDDDDNGDTDVEIATVATCALQQQNTGVSTRKIPGTVGFLEMEEEPPRTPLHNNYQMTKKNHSIYDPIQTSSGLLLTHRRVPPPSSSTTTNATTIRTQFEMEGGNDGTSSKNPRGHYNSTLPSSSSSSSSSSYPYSLNSQYFNPMKGTIDPRSLFPSPSSLTPILRYVRIWMIFSVVILLSGTVVLLHHTMYAKDAATDYVNASTEEGNNNFSIEYDERSGIYHVHDGVDNDIQLIPLPEEEYEDETEQIILLPLPDQNQHRRRLEQQDAKSRQLVGIPALIHDDNNYYHTNHHQQNHSLLERTLRNLHTLRDEFDAWMMRHEKNYDTEEERRYRFQIWSHNHDRTIEKNERHGPCTMTGQKVFGSNHLQDLTSEEFKSLYLNGYYLSRDPIRKGMTEPEHVVLGLQIDATPQYHPTLHDRLLLSNNEAHHDSIGIDYHAGCKWYDVSCILRYIFSTFLYGLGGTMEPAYDANSYPTAMDWRTLGAVTDIHSQSSCGACWAITAVETVESVYFISTGKLYDLAETEVIVCETNGEMCAGGWPQDAFDYVIKNNGLPLESAMPYNADFLVQVSDQIAGNSDQLNAETVATYQQQTCPSGGGNDNHSGDSASVSGSNTFTRYGKIKGYGYSTSKCVCYTDGSGCDCDHQNEGYAVRNLATYGPAVVCLDASTWQDYTGGIITSDSGCSMGFMDVNHCVQAVGYAYISDEEYDIEVNENQSGDKNKNSHSGSGSGSQDSTKRKGYWIVRNQWSTYWGMSGYAYVAMGDNTCGILNDMMQAYT